MENPEQRPTLKELKKKYIKFEISRGNILNLDISIYKITKSIIAPNELMTGRLCIMEFFTKIKFIKYFFHINN